MKLINYRLNAAKAALSGLIILVALWQGLPCGTPTAFAISNDAVNRVSSEPALLQAGPVRDIEAELRKKFDYPIEGRPYSANDSAYSVVYTEEQKQAQRAAAKAMVAELQRAVKSPEVHRFTIPKGIYRVGVEEIALTGARDFTIYAPGVELIVDTEKRGAAFLFVSCTNVTLTGRAAAAEGKERPPGTYLTIDSEQLPMSVARILASDAQQMSVDVEILPGYSMNIPETERMLTYDPAGRMLNVQQMGWKNATPLDGRRFRLAIRGPRDAFLPETILKPGNLLALHINAADRGANHSVYASRGCRDMTYESIRVYSGGGCPVDHGTAGDTVFRDWRLFARPGTSRLPVAAGLGQFSKNGGKFLFEDCEFGPHLDDGINLLSGMSVVGKSEGGSEIVVTGGQMPTVGSKLTFYEYTSWESCGEARVVSSALLEDPDTLAAVNAFAKKNRTRENARHAYRTVLDHAVHLPAFAMVVHSDNRADAIEVRGCLFRDQLAQIMVLQGAKSGLIEENLLLRSTGAAISPQFSQYWWEGPMPSNFVIRNNVIRDNPVAAAVTGFAGNASIAVYAGTRHPSNARLLHNFRIENNTIVNPSFYGIAIRNADGVVVRNNRIINPGACAVTGTYNGRPISELYAAIVLDAVSDAVVTDNEIVFENPRCQRAILVEANCDAATLHLERNREIHPEPAKARKE